MESIAGQSHSNIFVRRPSRNVRSDARDSSNRYLKRRFDATSGGDTETVSHCEPQDRRDSRLPPAPDSVTLPERSEGLSTEARPAEQSYDATDDGPASNSNNEDASRTSGSALQHSPTLARHHLRVGGMEEAYALNSQADEAWIAQDVSSLGEITSLDMAMLPDHVLSPSISSSYNLEDGIFEPGSAYQNLFQSLRSQVFRTAQIESDGSRRGHTSTSKRNPIVAGDRDAFGAQSTGIAGSTTRNGNTTNAQEFELPPAQEYLLWKAWTEEVSIWVRKDFASIVTTQADKNLA